MPEVYVINFGHPLTGEHLADIAAITGQKVSQVITVPSHIDPGEPLEPQVEAMLDRVGLTPEEWQTRPLIVNLPSLNYSAAVLLAQLHGRMGHFPPVLRLRPASGNLVPRFEVAEILNLQAIRDKARGKR
ncbi:MAG: CRISPR-associated protein Csx15 [Bacillota bacterium]